jgi:thiol-disulfide isomerase/thioredoxin
VVASVVAVRLSSRGPADPTLEKLITEVTTAPSGAAVPVATPAVVATPVALPTLVPPGGAAFSGTGTFSAVASLADSSPTQVSGPPLTSSGKPEVLYVGAEYCPYCVAESWSLIIALSRFGTFSGLRTSRSAHFDGIPPIDGWTFYGSAYTSPYLTFVPVETRSNVAVINPSTGDVDQTYRALQKLTPSERAVFNKLDTSGSVPFLDFGGRATLVGTGVSPGSLVGKTWNQIAVGLRHPQSPAGTAILAAANMLTAEFCQFTGNRPAAACQK